ncbi:hypothetical protein KIN20_023734 [Parelaphostrongylus tenuis]|uniref:Uncharacterized protein n=1 Tax=Parelaphostrongylus tenuis TaxID=148309 RepID=A0AAD5N9D4_PARTN|nr:hypothetical protein KIN20_023734 [Parelaphostrongylus tenuis]
MPDSMLGRLRNTTINLDVYEEQLRKLAAAVQVKRLKRLTVALLQNNARSHIAKLLRNFLKKVR